MIIPLRIDLSKNTKFTYYFVNILRSFVPYFFYKQRRKNLLKNIKEPEYIKKRVDYYNKHDVVFQLPQDAVNLKTFTKKEKKKTYYFDLLEYVRYYDKHLKFSYLFGDITHVPTEPHLLKSRPIQSDNKNSILFKLNKVRHFIFTTDTIKFQDKKNILVWRGKCYTQARQKFIREFYSNQQCNIGQTNTKGDTNLPWQKEKMQLKEQLQYKFILAIEGNDVASNLKWIMSSNSIAFMVKPTYETWFMEGTLIPNFHYVLLKDDYSDLEEKIHYYAHNIEASLQIIKNANEYVAQFKNKENEDIISLLVLEKYFQKSQQLEYL